MISDSDLFEEARDAFVEQRNIDALLIIERFLARQSGDFDAWLLKGDILRAMDNATGALTAVERALALRQNDYRALADKAVTLTQWLDDLENGLEFARRSYAAMIATVTSKRRRDPESNDYWAVEGVYGALYDVLCRLGRSDEAASVRAEALAFGHEFPEGVLDGD